ncbi:MAG: hypothetical protein IKS90_02065 [Clostridia bacterium]|nr:hypothetical protein [Clostridia bacterium]
MKTRLMILSAFCLGIAVALSLAACAGKTPSATPAPLTAAPSDTEAPSAPAAVTAAPATAKPTAEPTAAPTIQPGEILLLGEDHTDPSHTRKELERWGEFYAKGDRHLFIEVACYEADYLNQWMKESSDEMLYRLFDEWEGTLSDNSHTSYFYMQIKRSFPETVFHGTDVGHTFFSTGRRYLKELEDAGQENSEAYIRAKAVVEQGQMFHHLGSVEGDTYRETCMVQNFLWEYDKIAGENIMGIYGAFHTDLLGMSYYNGVSSMAKQLAVRFGDALKSENLTLIDVISTGVMTVDGREYEVSYFGSENMALWHPNYEKRVFWRLENAYEDFASYPLMDEVLPYDNYPMEISTGQVFVIDYYKRDGTVHREYYRSDGTYWKDRPCTERFSLDG